MPNPITIVIPHELGAAQAKRRLDTGLNQLKADYLDKIAASSLTWSGDHADISARAIGQSLTATIDVADTSVTVSVVLPWPLAALAERAQGFIKSRAGAALAIEDKTKPKA